ncbi:MAG TPA: LLM class flavin-dependent oxidoreductase, partial [Acidimicrobiales bacterium]|nr:LLM class flavin-dependent oxidoreductase [Acidimicrobiales bacterium]
IADDAGLDVFGVGEHHRPDFAIASPAVVLAAVAQATERIRLTSTVTVLSTADPVKVFVLGQPERFAPLAELYRTTGAGAGHGDGALRIGVTSHFYVEPTPQGARDTFFPYYSRYIGNNMPGARGQLLPRHAFDSWAARRGALFAGSPQEIIDKILWEHEILGHDRFLAQIGLGGLPFTETARSIELLATDVLPVVRRETIARTPPQRSSLPAST